MLVLARLDLAGFLSGAYAKEGLINGCTRAGMGDNTIVLGWGGVDNFVKICYKKAKKRKVN